MSEQGLADWRFAAQSLQKKVAELQVEICRLRGELEYPSQDRFHLAFPLGSTWLKVEFCHEPEQRGDLETEPIAEDAEAVLAFVNGMWVSVPACFPDFQEEWEAEARKWLAAQKYNQEEE
jgi:hypothetical protein